MLKCNMSWDYLTEAEAEELLQATYKNPMIVTIKAPSVPGGMLENAKFRVIYFQFSITLLSPPNYIILLFLFLFVF